MKIVVSVPTIDREHGGPARTVPALCRCFVDQAIDVELVTVAEYGKKCEKLGLGDLKAQIIETTATRYQSSAWSRQFKQALRNALNETGAILYDVGLWLPSNHFAARIAQRTGTSFVISPRGMLSQEALKISKWKKRVAWWLYQQRDLKRAHALHATSHKEAEEFRALKLRQPIAVIPNGVDVPDVIPRTTDYGELDQEKRTALFLSRIHPMKGLPDLIKAWAKIRPQAWRLVIVGPDETGHRAECQELADAWGIAQDLRFVGEVDDQQKWKLFAESDLFVLPSYSESFGMAIAEALAASVPVITTKATPWQEIESNRCGWWVNTGVESIAAALQSATACSREELKSMGQRGWELVSQNYSWESAAKKLISVFAWVLNRGEKPNCVV